MDFAISAILTIAVTAIWLLPLVVVIKRQKSNAAKQTQSAGQAAHSNVREIYWGTDNKRSGVETISEEGKSTIRDLHRKQQMQQQSHKKNVHDTTVETEQPDDNEAAERLRTLLSDDIRSAVIAGELIERRY